MVIYSIVIFMNNGQEITASLPADGTKIEPHERLIREKAHLFKYLENPPVYVKFGDAFYYAVKRNDRNFAVAVDQELSSLTQKELFYKITLASDQFTLINLINHPESVNQIERINKDLEETKNKMVSNIDNIIENHAQIKEITLKAERTMKECERFNEQAVKLKERYRCPNLLFFLGLARNYFFGEPKPESPPKLKNN